MTGRLLALIVCVGLIVAACSTPSADSVASSATTTPPPATTTRAIPTTSSAIPPGTTDADRTTTTSGREVAPDFTLELGDGGTYTLSEGTKPVYLVFWAEW